jgi:hypothetical protein
MSLLLPQGGHRVHFGCPSRRKPAANTCRQRDDGGCNPNARRICGVQPSDKATQGTHRELERTNPRKSASTFLVGCARPSGQQKKKRLDIRYHRPVISYSCPKHSGLCPV